jgi:hypothetical protein
MAAIPNGHFQEAGDLRRTLRSNLIIPLMKSQLHVAENEPERVFLRIIQVPNRIQRELTGAMAHRYPLVPQPQMI